MGLVAAVTEIVGLLRDAARMVKDLEAEVSRLRKEVSDLRVQVHNMEEDWALHSCKEDVFEDWQALLLDYRSGLRDKDELLDGTVGRR